MNSIKKTPKLEKSADLDLVVFVMKNLVYQTGVMVKVILYVLQGEEMS